MCSPFRGESNGGARPAGRGSRGILGVPEKELARCVSAIPAVPEFSLWHARRRSEAGDSEGTVQQMASGVNAALLRQKEIRAAQAQPAKAFASAFAPTKNAIATCTLD